MLVFFPPSKFSVGLKDICIYDYIKLYNYLLEFGNNYFYSKLSLFSIGNTKAKQVLSGELERV
jgi:hypothetical protein